MMFEYIKSTYKRTGTLWEGRYKSSVVRYFQAAYGDRKGFRSDQSSEMGHMQDPVQKLQ